jgi:hypothetical protein
MQKFTKHRRRLNLELSSPQFYGAWTKALCFGLLGAVMVLSGCGGGSSQMQTLPPLTSGNWQFNQANPPDQSFQGGLQGGFLSEKNGSLTGTVAYFVSLPSQTGGPATVCSTGSAPITGTISGQNVSLTAVAGTQTFTFTGTLSPDGLTLTGTYDSTAGTTVGGAACGTAQTGLQWNAISVQPLSGTIQGSFHSTGGTAGLSDQNFPVSMTLVQGGNGGTSNASVTGNVSFIDPTTLVSNYPCFATAAVSGQISGTSVVLQMVGSDGSSLGQIGGSGLSPVTFDSTASGYVLHSAASPAYAVNTRTCSGIGLFSPGDYGAICLAVGKTTCPQPTISVSPKVLTFPAESAGSIPITQTITLANSSGSSVNNLELQWLSTEVNNVPDFVESDNCAASLGSPFVLNTGQFCTVTISFTPQESCSPTIAPSLCPTATLSLLSDITNADDNPVLTVLAVVPISGAGLNAASTISERNFGAEVALDGTTPGQGLSFTQHSKHQEHTLIRSGDRDF